MTIIWEAGGTIIVDATVAFVSWLVACRSLEQDDADLSMGGRIVADATGASASRYVARPLLGQAGVVCEGEKGTIVDATEFVSQLVVCHLLGQTGSFLSTRK